MRAEDGAIVKSSVQRRACRRSSVFERRVSASEEVEFSLPTVENFLKCWEKLFRKKDLQDPFHFL